MNTQPKTFFAHRDTSTPHRELLEWLVSNNSAGVRAAGTVIRQDLQFIGVDNFALASALADRERLADGSTEIWAKEVAVYFALTA
jgi:hypothetical protein